MWLWTFSQDSVCQSTITFLRALRRFVWNSEMQVRSFVQDLPSYTCSIDLQPVALRVRHLQMAARHTVPLSDSLTTATSGASAWKPIRKRSIINLEPNRRISIMVPIPSHMLVFTGSLPMVMGWDYTASVTWENVVETHGRLIAFLLAGSHNDYTELVISS
jgi:hypothetical protein